VIQWSSSEAARALSFFDSHVWLFVLCFRTQTKVFSSTLKCSEIPSPFGILKCVLSSIFLKFLLSYRFKSAKFLVHNLSTSQCTLGATSKLLTYLLTPYSRVLLEKLTGFAASQEIPAFLEPRGSSPYSQVPATCPYPEPTPSSPHIPLPLPEDPS